jgi:nocardicin nonribosomal peptide synthetase NocA
VPSVVVPVEHLPRTTNGKLDRAALPPPTEVPSHPSATGPRNAVESALLEAWREVLSRPEAGVHDDFFDLGGDSISAIRIVSRVRGSGLHLGLADVLRAPTVAELARRTTGPAPALPPRRGHGSVRPTPNQLAFLAAHPATARFTQAVLLDVDEAVEPSIFERALVALVRRHDALRQRFTTTTDGTVMVRVPPADDRADRLVALRAAPDDRPEALRALAESGLDVAAGPTVGASWARGPGGLRLLVSVHHLTVDTISWQILLDDLARALDDLRRGDPVTLPEPPCPVQRWADALGARPPAADTVRWLAQLDPPGSTAGPTAARAQPSGAGVARAATALPHGTVARLERRAYELGARLGDLVLAAAVLVWAGRAGRARVSALVEVHGRDRDDVDLSRAVGWIAPSFPVRPALPPDPTMADAVAATVRALGELPRNRHGYRALRVAPDRPLAARPEPGLAVNHLGRASHSWYRGLLRPAATQPPHVDPVWRPVGDEAVAVETVVGVDGHLELTVEADASILDDGVVTALARDIRHELAGFAATTGLVRVEAGLTPMQAGMLSGSLAAPAAGLYHTQALFEVRGEVDDEVLRAAWADVAAAADAFRTAFRWTEAAQPRQFVERDVLLDWTHHRVEHDELEQAWERLLAQDRARPFDLSVAPLSRLGLVTAGPVRRLLWSHHHAVFDGWSLPLVTSAVGRAYRHRLARAAPPAPLPSHLAFAAWVADQDTDAARAYFGRSLAGLAAPTLLQGGGSGAGGFAVATLGAERTGALQAQARHHRTTLNVIVLSAWTLVVRDAVGVDDVVLGVVLSLRPPEVPDVDRLVGLCMNTVPVRVRVDDDIPFSRLVETLQQALLSAYPHAHAPLGRVVADAGLGGALFDTVFVYENYPGDRTGEPLGAHGHLAVLGSRESTDVPWTLIALPGQELRLELHHHGADLDQDRAHALVDRLCAILTTVAEAS